MTPLTQAVTWSSGVVILVLDALDRSPVVAVVVVVLVLVYYSSSNR